MSYKPCPVLPVNSEAMKTTIIIMGDIQTQSKTLTNIGKFF